MGPNATNNAIANLFNNNITPAIMAGPATPMPLIHMARFFSSSTIVLSPVSIDCIAPKAVCMSAKLLSIVQPNTDELAPAMVQSAAVVLPVRAVEMVSDKPVFSLVNNPLPPAATPVATNKMMNARPICMLKAIIESRLCPETIR